MRVYYVCVLFVALVVAAPLHADQIVDPSTGSIVGTVRDATGAVLRAVDITISGPALMTPRKDSTDADGSYRFVNLPTGEYTLAYAQQGFAASERTVPVSLAFTATVDA